LHKNCLLKHIIEGKIEETGRWERCKKLLDDLNEMRRYWKLKKEALDHTLWRTCIGKRLWTCHKRDYVMMMNTVLTSQLNLLNKSSNMSASSEPASSSLLLP
jgi:hypothetical protein